jgi:hypothetical protein
MRCPLRVIKFIAIAAAIISVLGFVVMRLWNGLLPGLFGMHTVTFVQAVGLLILSKILFGGFRGGPGMQMAWKRRMMERWVQMTPEEREKFRAGLQQRCGFFGAGEPEEKPKE